jgi:hypothetical protein
MRDGSHGTSRAAADAPGPVRAVIRRERWPFWSRSLSHAFGGRSGDRRDRPAIDAWSDSMATALSRAQAPMEVA